jgi:hypothetical protein
VKTAETGYIQRQLVKAMEDLVVQNDGTVRDAKMNIIQYHYGEDGVNSTKIENQSLDLQKLTEADIRKVFGLQGVDMSSILSEGVVREEDEPALTAYVDQVLNDRKMLVDGVFKKGKGIAIYSPVNIERIALQYEGSGNLQA